MQTERRTFNVELRGSRGSRKITGYAALFNEESQDLGGFIEVIRPGAFRRTIKTADVRALWNHDDNFVLGRTKSGTLRLAEDDRGLRIDVDPPDAQWAKDLIVSIERGDVDQMSFAFSVAPGGDRWGERKGKPLRELFDVDLYDVSPVTYPAYTQTTVSAEARNRAKTWNGPNASMWRRIREHERWDHERRLRELQRLERQVQRDRELGLI